MLVASRLTNNYQLGETQGLSITITEEEYIKLQETSGEKTHKGLPGGFVIITTDAGFTEEELKEFRDRIRDYHSDNKIKLPKTEELGS